MELNKLKVLLIFVVTVLLVAMCKLTYPSLAIVPCGLGGTYLASKLMPSHKIADVVMKIKHLLSLFK
jgi:hypothetical protein